MGVREWRITNDNNNNVRYGLLSHEIRGITPSIDGVTDLIKVHGVGGKIGEDDL